MLLGQIALVLRRQVYAPVNRVLELLSAFLEDRHRVGVVHLRKIGRDEALQTGYRVAVYALGEEFHVVRTLFQHRFEDIFQHRFRQTCNIIQVGERHFRLQHPEFRQVTAGVGVFGTEGRAKGVDFRQRAGVRFAVELTGYGQEGLFTKEVFVIVHFTFRGARQVFEIQR